MLHVANAIFLSRGLAELNIGLELRTKKYFDRTDSIEIPIVVMLALILFVSSFTIVPTEEKRSLFKRQQLMTGLWSGTYWFVTLLYDAIVVALVCLAIFGIIAIFVSGVSWLFLGLMCLYCVINLPLVYLVSSILCCVGGSFLFLLIFQSLAFIPPLIVGLYLKKPSTSTIRVGNDVTEEKERLNKFNAKSALIVKELNSTEWTLRSLVCLAPTESP
ncbi:hypothetical protein COOONC_13370 [Cooperia oncophora]